MAVTAPLGSVVSSLLAGAVFAGADLPLVTLLAFATSLVWIFMLTRFSKKINAAGGFYTYTSNSIGGKAGYAESVTEFMAFLLTTVFEGMFVGILVPSFLKVIGIDLPSWSWVPLTLVGVGLAIPMTCMNIGRLLNKYVAIAATTEVGFLILLGLYFVLKAGAANTLSVFTDVNLSPHGLGGLATGYLLAVISIAGAGTATYLGEETKSPGKNVSRGMWLASLLGGGSMILATYGVVVAFGVSNAAALGSSAAPVVELAAKASGILALILVGLSVNSLIVSNIGTNLSASRILFSLAREGGVPSVFARLNGRKSPYLASIFVGFVAVAISLGTPLIMGPYDAYLMVAVAASVFWILGRIGDSLSLPLFYFRRFRNEFSLVKHLLPSVFITAITIVGLGLSLVPVTYPENFSLALVSVVFAAWLSAFGILSGGAIDRIGSYVVGDDGKLQLSSFVFSSRTETRGSLD